MKFIPYITFFLLLFMAGEVLYINFAKKREKLIKLITENLLRKASHQVGEIYFFSPAIRHLVTHFMLSFDKKAKEALFLMCHGKETDEMKNYINECSDKYLSATYNAFSNMEFAEEIFSEIAINNKIRVQRAYIAMLKGKKDEMDELLYEVDEKKLPIPEKALYRYCMAKKALEIGDLYNAANDAGVAVKLFHKTKSFYEEAQTYILLGEIYRVSAATDMAYFMYTEAKKIAEKQHNEPLKADILGNLGMLFTMQERYDAAAEVFTEALEINKKNIRDKACACIYNQMSLMSLLNTKYDMAKLYANQALRYSASDTDAFSFELMAKVDFAMGKYEDAIKNADVAKKKYWKYGNLSAYFDALYLEASSLFNLQKYDEAEEKLRHLISIEQENKTVFHVANAYSLLGSIFMKKGEYKRAKPFFEESIRHELKNNRPEGMVSDYVNIGIILKNQDDKEGALMNFNEAKRYAAEVQNEELSALVDKYIEDLK